MLPGLSDGGRQRSAAAPAHSITRWPLCPSPLCHPRLHAPIGPWKHLHSGWKMAAGAAPIFILWPAVSRRQSLVAGPLSSRAAAHLWFLALPPPCRSMVAPATAAIAVPPGYAAPGIPQPAAKGAGGPHLVPSSGSTEAALRSQESSPGKPLPPKTPAPTHLDAAPPPPSSQWPPSALTQALRRGGSGGGAVPLQEPWGRPEHAGTAANGTAAAVSGREGHAVSEDEEEAMLHDDVLLFNAPAVGSGVPDPQLLVHSPDSSLAADDGLLAAADAARSSGPASPTTSSLEVQQQREAGGGAPAPAAAAAAGCAGSADGDGDGERTPRQSSALHSMPGALDVLSPGAEPGFSLAEMLQVGGGWGGGWLCSLL